MTQGAKTGARPSAGGTAPAKPAAGLIVLLGAITTFAAVSIEMYLPALPVIAADLHAWPGGVELTISTFLIALAAGQLFYGPLSDRLGRRPPLIAGLVLYCAASVACALATTVDQLIVFRFLQALGGCAGAVIARAVIRDTFPASQMVSVLSVMALVTGLAPLLAPLAGGAMLQVAPWRGILWVQAGYGVAVLLATLLFLRETAPRQRDKPREPLLAGYRAVLTNRRTMGYALTQGFSGSVTFIYAAALPAITTRYGLSPGQLAIVLGAGGAGMMVSAQFNRPLLKRFSSDEILKAANLASVLLAGLTCAVAWTGVFGFAGLITPLLALMTLRGLSLPHATASAMMSETRHIGAAAAVVGAQSFGWGAALSALTASFTDGTPRAMAAAMFLATVMAAVVLRGVALPTKAA